ncbi:hypothetical protein EDB89DRAFT_1985822, partial [Lactarius sanguifluus]
MGSLSLVIVATRSHDHSLVEQEQPLCLRFTYSRSCHPPTQYYWVAAIVPTQITSARAQNLRTSFPDLQPPHTTHARPSTRSTSLPSSWPSFSPNDGTTCSPYSLSKLTPIPAAYKQSGHRPPILICEHVFKTLGAVLLTAFASISPLKSETL